MSDLFHRLKPKERRGSKMRCHLLTHGSPEDVAGRLTALAAPWAEVRPTDRWMPAGFEAVVEAQLHRAPRLLDPGMRAVLRDWWLAPASTTGKTPNWDIASTCLVQGSPGLLLIEAKAHDEELHKEEVGRTLKPVLRDRPETQSEADRRASHGKIGLAIEEAANGLTAATGHQWQISRDSRYQMSNRFAWSWKLTQLGVPVVLVYLGFLQASEMTDRGVPFESAAEWERLVWSHSEPLFPRTVWEQRWECGGHALVPLIRTLTVDLKGPLQT